MIDLIRAALAAAIPAGLILLAAAAIGVILDHLDDPQHAGPDDHADIYDGCTQISSATPTEALRP